MAYYRDPEVGSGKKKSPNSAENQVVSSILNGAKLAAEIGQKTASESAKKRASGPTSSRPSSNKLPISEISIKNVNPMEYMAERQKRGVSYTLKDFALEHDLRSGDSVRVKEYNNYLNSMQSFTGRIQTDFDKRSGKYQKADSFRSYQADRESEIDGLRKQTDYFTEYFNRYGSTFDKLYGPAGSEQVLEDLRQYSEYLANVSSDLKKEGEYWDQFDDERQYKLSTGELSLEDPEVIDYLYESQIKGYDKEIAGVQKEIDAYRNKGEYPEGINAVFQHYEGLEEKKKKLESEKAETQAALEFQKKYGGLEYEDDFDRLSQYKSTKNGRKVSFTLSGGQLSESGFDDISYDYINKNPEAIQLNDNQNTVIGATGAGVDDSFLKQMTDGEVKRYNYLYQKRGKDAAEEYLKALESTLTARQRVEDEKKDRQEAREHPVLTSAFSVLTNPLNGLSYIGQLADYVDDGKIDQNAGYNKFSLQNTAIRDEVSRIAEKNWGKPGSFLYQTGMSMADFAYNALISGSFSGGAVPAELASNLSLAIMGSGAAASATIEAKDRGLSDGQSLALGTIAGFAEVATEKVSLEKLLDKTSLGKNALGYWLQNVVAEGSEEVASDMINLFADIMISKDKSKWQSAVNAYIDEGHSEEKAFALAVRDQMIETGLSGLGGALSGGVMAGEAIAVNGIQNGMENRSMYKDTVQNGQAYYALNQLTRGELARQNGYMDIEQDYKSPEKNEELTKALQSQGLSQKEIDNLLASRGASAGMETHSPEMQKVMAEYEAAVDPELRNFIQDGIDGKLHLKARYYLDDVTAKAAKDIQDVTGVNVEGFKTVLDRSTVEHIESRHGEYGKADRSMRDANDVARIQYVLHNYDTVENTGDVTNKFRNSDNTRAQVIRFSKRIDGTYYVAEAVPNSSRQEVNILTAYKTKAESSQQVAGTKGALPTAKTGLAREASAFDNSIPKKTQSVNTDKNSAEDITQVPNAVTTTPRFTSETGIPSLPSADSSIAGQGQNVNTGVFGEASLRMTPMEALQWAQNNNTLQGSGGSGYGSELAEQNGAWIETAQGGSGTADSGQVVLPDGNPGWRSYERETGRHERVPEAVRKAGRTAENRVISQKRRTAVSEYEAVSPEELGVPSGSKAATCRALPEGEWDDEIQRGVEWAYSKGIKKVTPVVGEIQIEQDGRSGDVVGTINEATGEIFVRCDTVTTSFSENLEHEVAHQMTAPNDATAFERQVRERFGDKAWDAIFDTYRQRYAAITNGFAGMEESEIAGYISEEIMADAYSGADKFGRKASLYGAIADQVLEGNVLQAKLPTDAPSEGYSHLAENTPEVRGPPEKQLTEKQLADEDALWNRERFAAEENERIDKAVSMLDNGRTPSEVFGETGLVVMSNGDIRDGIGGKKIGEWKNGGAEGNERTANETSEKAQSGNDERRNRRKLAESSEMVPLKGWNKLSAEGRRQIISAVQNRMKNATAEGEWYLKRYGGIEAFAKQFYSDLQKHRALAEEWVNFIPDIQNLMDEIEDIAGLDFVRDDEISIRFSISEELPEELNAVLSNTFPSEKSEVVIGETSDYLVNTLHAQPLRVTMPANKAYAAMVTEEQAKQAGRYNSRLNYHGLGRDGFVRILAASENPLAAFAAPTGEGGNKRDNRIVLVTDELVDGKNAVVITEMNSSIAAGSRKETVNKDITVYPRGQVFQDILRADAEGRLLDLDKKKSHQSLGFLASNSLAAIREDDFSTNIRNFWDNVNYQNSGNHSTSFGTAGNTAMRKAFEDAGWNENLVDKQSDGKVNSAENERFAVSDEEEAGLVEQKDGTDRPTEQKTEEQLEAEFAALQKQLKEMRKEMQARKGEKPAARKAEQKPPKENKPYLAKRDLRRNLLSLFSIPEGQKAELGEMIDSYADRLRENGRLTQEDRDAFFDRMYEEGVMEVPADSYLQDGREAVKGKKIYVNDSIRAEFGDDWSSFVRKAFNSQVYLTNDPNDYGPDVWNQELAEVLPGLFDEQETDSRATLEQIVQVAEEGKTQKMSLAEFAASMANEGYVSEDEILDNMERQMDWALRTFAEKASLEVHLRDRTGVKLDQERAKRKESMERQRNNRELRELQQKTLKQLQWLSKNQFKAPEDLKQAFQDALADIDIYAVSAANEMNWSNKYQATWKDLKDMYLEAKGKDNFLPSEELKKIVDRLDKKKIEDMELGALQDLYRVAVGLRTEFYNRKNVIDDDRRRQFEEVYRDSKNEIESAGKGYKTGPMGAAGRFMNYEEMTPINVLEMMGGWDPDGTFYSMAKQLEKGERDMRDYEVRAKRMLDGFIQEHQDWIKKADGQGKDAIWYEIEVPELLQLNMGDKPIFGDTVKVYMTPAQKVHLYLESKNYDNLRHMVGGRTFASKKLYSKGKRTEAFADGTIVKLAPETVKKLVSDLTPEEEELAKVLEEYYNTFAAKEINKVSNTLYGYDKAISKNYAPIYTDQNFTKSEIGVFDVTAEGVGNLKERQKSKNPSYNLSAFDAFERHVKQTARFVGMSIPARNMNTLLNWQDHETSMMKVITGEEGKRDGFGDEGLKYIKDLIKNLQSGGTVSEKGVVDRFTDKMLSKYVSAVFGFNPGIVFKQAASFPQFASALGWKNLSLGRVDENLINTYTSELAYRKLGYATPETALLKNNPGKLSTNKAYQFLFGGGAITAMDAFTVKRAWSWAEKKVRNEHPEVEVGTPEQVAAGESPFYKKVAEEWENAVSLTQPMYDEMHRAKIMKGSNGITRAFTMFKTVPLQQYNSLRRNLGELNAVRRKFGNNSNSESVNAKAREQVRKASWKAATAITATLGSVLMLEAVEFLNQLWKNRGKKYRDEEDELTVESIMERVLWNSFGDTMGMVTFGGGLADLIENKITGSTWYGIEIPGGEQLDDILESTKGAAETIEKFVGDSFNVISNGGDWGEYVRRNAGDYLGAVKDILETVSMYLGGFPMANMEKYLMGSLPEEIRVKAETLFDTPTKTDLKGLSGGALEARAEYFFGVRNVQIGEDTTAKISELYRAQLTDAVPADTPSKVTVGEEERTLNAYQKQTYDRVWGGIMQDSLDSLVASESFQNAEAEIQAKMLKKLYGYADAKAKSVLYDDFPLGEQFQKADKIVEAGGTAADWAAWTVESSGMKAEEKYLALAEKVFSDAVKKAIVGNETGTELKTESGEDTQYAKMLQLLESGMDMDEYLLLKAKGTGAVDKYLKYSEKKRGISFEKYNTLKDNSALDEFDKLSGAGVNAANAYDTALALEDLGEDPATVEKYMAIAEMPYQEEVKDQALKAIMSDSAYAKYQKARGSGIPTYTYCKFLRDTGDYSGDGKREKIWEYINALPISSAQKDALHLSMYKESSLAKAPWH